MEKNQQEMQAKMAEEMAKFASHGTTLFAPPAVGTAMPTAANSQVYTYGPNGELVAKPPAQ